MENWTTRLGILYIVSPPGAFNFWSRLTFDKSGINVKVMKYQERLEPRPWSETLVLHVFGVLTLLGFLLTDEVGLPDRTRACAPTLPTSNGLIFTFCKGGFLQSYVTSHTTISWSLTFINLFLKQFFKLWSKASLAYCFFICFFCPQIRTLNAMIGKD